MQQRVIQGKQFSVIGAARSGIAVARLLKARGAEVFVSDQAPATKMQPVIAELEKLHVAYEFGGNTSKVLDADVIVLSPGVPSDSRIVLQAKGAGRSVVSEIEAASWFCPGPIVAITGTNGKTTTTTLLGRIFEDAKKPAMVAGNIGLAFSQVVDQVTEQSTAILEVSSFQLDHIETFGPKVAVWLNVTPDHLDRYEHIYEKYIAAKCRVFENQRRGDTLVYNADDEVETAHVQQRINAEVTLLPFSTRKQLEVGAFVDQGMVKTRVRGRESDVIPVKGISIPGEHNLSNALAAVLVSQVMGVSTASIRATLKNFKGVEHRLEFVRSVQGVSYVNDSKATNVDSVWYALQSFESPIVLLLGGRDKGNDYSRLFGLVRKHVKAIVAIGESAGKVVDAFRTITQVTTASDMKTAVQAAASMAAIGDIVLLSPACASFDWFENYEHRGRVFKELVRAL